jgi:hypothetical protein
MQERGDFVRCRLFRGEELRRIQLQAAVSGEGYGSLSAERPQGTMEERLKVNRRKQGQKIAE